MRVEELRQSNPNNYYGYIYAVIDLETDKKYIGQHKGKFSNTYYGRGIYIKRAIKKYGKEHFKMKLIDWAFSKEELDKLEVTWIKKMDCIYPMGYNIAPGGDGNTNGSKYWLGKHHTQKTIEKIKQNHVGMKGKHHTEETKEKMKLGRIGKVNPMYGKSLSEKTKEKIRQSTLGIKKGPHSEKTKEKIRQTKLGKCIGKNNPFYGKHHSEKTKLKLRLFNLGK